MDALFLTREEAEAALEALEIGNPCSTMADAKRQIADTRPADVVPVVHGQWVDGKCSNCGVDIPTDDAHDAIFETECRFCYYCGAKMDGGADNGAD
jgi:hypothetical protein